MLTIRAKIWLWFLGIASFLTLAAIDRSSAREEPAELVLEKRLIQTGPSTVRWMHSNEVESIQKKQHSRGRCAGFMDITHFPDLQKNLGNVRRRKVSTPLKLQQVPFTRSANTILSKDEIHESINRLSGFNNRYYTSKTGIEAAKWIKRRFEELARNRGDVSVKLFQHRNYPQPSVIAEIPGSDPLKKKELVILGGHLDSINHRSIFKKNARAPGADDNASGIAVLLETFRVLMEKDFRPKRTVQFIGYAAEEVGLRGSLSIAKYYSSQKRKVVGVMQLDMTGYPQRSRQVVLVDDYVDKDLTNLVRKIADKHLGYSPQRTKCGYACSDHASWTRYGYPSAFPFESSFSKANRSIHTSGDTLSRLNVEFALDFAKIGVGFAAELGMR